MGAYPDWWVCYQRAQALGLWPWEISGEPDPAKLYWILRLEEAAWAEATARTPLGE